MTIQVRRCFKGTYWALITLSFSCGTLGDSLSTPEDREWYIFELRTGKHILDLGLPAFIEQKQLYIHFGALISATRFSIEEKNHDLWEGWYFNQDNIFSLNRKSTLVMVGKNKGIRLNTVDILDDEDGIYVSAKALSEWFGITYSVDYHQQIITLDAEALFLVEILAKRESELLKFHKISKEKPFIVDDQYSWFTPPQLDFRANLTHSDNDETSVNGAFASIATSFDFLKQQVFYTNSTTHTDGSEVSSAQRLTFERRASTQNSALFLGAGRYEFGDVFLPSTNLASRGGTGTGFIMERNHNRQNVSQGTVVIEGDALPGWSANLYRNDQLMALGKVGGDGRYIFREQLTVPGKNVFVVQLYGPLGETLKQEHIVYGGGLALSAGDYSYRFGHIDFSQYVLDGDIDTIGHLPAKNTTVAEIGYGIHKNLQIGASFYDSQVGERNNLDSFSNETYGLINFRANVLSGIMLGEWASQERAGSAWKLRYLGDLIGQTYALSHQEFDNDFNSPFTVRDLDVDTRTEVTLFGNIGPSFLDGYTLKATTEKKHGTFNKKELYSQLSGHVGSVYIGNDIRYYRVEGEESNTLGNVKVSGNFSRYTVSAGASYDPSEEKPFDLASASLRWRVNHALYGGIELTKQLKGTRDTYFKGELAWKRNALNILFDANISTTGFWSVGVGISTSIGYNKYNKRIYASDQSLSRSGRTALKFFLDENGNNRLDTREYILEDVIYDGVSSDKVAGNNYISINNIPAFSPVIINVEDADLNDPYLMPKFKTYEIFTHPSGQIELDIPVQLVGDIEGLVVKAIGGGLENLEGITVELLNEDGKLIKVATSEFDGYYSFTSVAVGKYQVRVLIERPYQLHEQSLHLTKEDNFLILDTIVL